MNSKSTVVARAPQSRGISASLRRLAARGAVGALAVGLALAGSLHSASAATFNYTGGGAGTAAAPVSGNFSTGFDGNVTTSDATGILNFAGSTDYTATDDLTTQILANMLNFSNAAGSTVTLARGGTGTSNSIKLGGTTPSLTTGAGAVVNNLDLTLAAGTTNTTGATFNIGAGGMTLGGLLTGGNTFLTVNGPGLLTLAGGVTGLGNNSVFNADSNVNITGNSTLSAALFNRGITAITAGTTTSAAQIIVIDNTGAANTSPLNGTLTVSGTGTLTGANFRIGSTAGFGANLTVGTGGAVTAGTSVEFSHSVVAGVTAVASNLNLNGGTFTTGVGFTMTSLGALNFNGGTLAITGALGNIAVNNTGNLAVNVQSGGGTVNVASAKTVTFSQPLAHSGTGTDGGLTKSGAGTLTLSGTSTYNGGTVVNAGTLVLTGTSDVGTGAIAVNGGTLQLGTNPTATNGNKALTAANAVTLAAGTTLAISQTNTPLTYAAFPITMNGNSTISFQGANVYTDTFTSPITLNNTGGTQAATIGETDAANTINLQGVISGTGDLKIAPGGNGNPFAVTINQAETYSGNTFLTQTTTGDFPQLKLLAGGALPSATVLTLTTGAAAPGRLTSFDLNGQAQTLGGLVSGGTAAGDAVINSTNATTSALTINAAGAASYTFTGSIGTSIANNNISLTKLGSGTQSLTGANTYTGGTTVTGGTLILGSNAADGTGMLTVNSGGTTTVTAGNALGGGNVTLAGGTLQNGNLTGTTLANKQTSAILSLTTGTASILDFGAGNTGGTFSFTGLDGTNTGTLLVQNWMGNPDVGNGLDQFIVGGTLLTPTQLSQITFNIGGTTFGAAQVASTGEVVATALAAAPEPSQYAAFAIGLLGLGALALNARKRALAA